MASAPRQNIATLQVGRGVAALAVVAHHAEQSVTRLVGELPAILATVLSYGYLGVDFFFVLSGFIIYYVNEHRVGTRGWPLSYVESRITRVYLPYLPIAIALGCAYLLLPRLSSGENNWNWWSTITLLPSSGGPALSVAWTLQHEILFYLAAFLCLYLRKVLVGSLIAAVAIVGFDLVGVGAGYKGLSLMDLEFLFGMFAAWCYIKGKLPYGWPLLAIGALLCASFFLWGQRDYSVLFGLGVAFLLLPIARAEASGRIRVAGLALLLGNASYAIYLVHHPIISLMARALRNIDPYSALAATILLPTLAGLLYHLLFERPLLRMVRRRLATWRRRTADASTTA